MPAVNRRSRVSPSKPQAVPPFVALLLTKGNKLVKVRSIGSANLSGDTQVLAIEPSGQSVDCLLPQDLHSQLLFKGSGFFIVAPDSPGSREQANLRVTQSATSEIRSDAVGISIAAQPTNSSPVNSNGAAVQSWRVVFVLADDDLPALARQGLWPAEFEAEGIDGISNGQQVDLRTVPKVGHPAQMQEAAAKTSAVLNQSFYDSDEEEEEHMLGCACCPGGRNVVFRVY